MEKYQRQPQIPQRTPEWYRKRSTMITASQVASILHLNSYRSHDELLKTPPDPNPPKEVKITKSNFKKIDPMTWGTVLESIAKQLLEQTTLHPVGTLGLKVHRRMPYLGASPDGIQIINGVPRLVEFKCPKTRQITYRIPLEYWVQMQIQMEVWNVNETLYCEYKFDLTTEKPTTRDLTTQWGQIAPGVYWVFQDYWATSVARNKKWFESIKPQILSFYQLKFLGGNPQGPPGDGSEANSVVSSAVSSSVVSSSMVSSSTSRKRGRSDDADQPVTRSKRQRTRAKSKATPSKYQWKVPSKDRAPINRLTNFLRNDPIVDWLEAHQSKHSYEKDKSLFLEFYNQKNLYHKLDQMRQCILTAKANDLTYRVLNISANNVLDIFHGNNLILKLQYDGNLLEETRVAMQEGIDVILMGQLSRVVSGYRLWDTFDILVRREHFQILFEGTRHLFNEIPSDMEYIPIKIKFTSLDRNSDFILKGKHKVDCLKSGTISYCLFMGRHGEFGIVPENDDLELIEEGLRWLEEVPNTRLADLYPNMKNKYDSPWHSAKEEIAERKEELTRINYLNVKIRERLHEEGITKISQLTPELVEEMELPYRSRILPHLSNELYLPELDMEPAPVEVYMDFESVSNLGTGEAIIFLMGILVKRAGQVNYYPFLVKNLNKKSEQEMLEAGLKFLSELGPDVPVFHWSSAECRMLNSAGYSLPDNCEWVDLYQHLSSNGASIPGCYSYGLKEVATRLYELGEIESHWLYGLDGTAAMVMAWNIRHKCKITGENFKDDPRIQKLTSYNYVDCQVMEEIRRLLVSEDETDNEEMSTDF